MSATRITCEDLDTGETDSVVITDDYCLVTDGRVYLAHQTNHANGTVVLTIKRREPQSGDPESCQCDGGAYGLQKHPFLVHPDCPVHQSGDRCVREWPDPGHEDEGYSCLTHNTPWGECTQPGGPESGEDQR